MRHRDRRYLTEVKYKYKLRADDYHALFDLQQGRCAICHTHQDELNERLAVDHDHQSGAVRGLLCRGCNKNLGWHEKRQTSAWVCYLRWPPMRELQYRRETPDDEQVHPL